jgi:NADPH-dependent glutamate synthase beta subunit-like oxidoreductase
MEDPLPIRSLKRFASEYDDGSPPPRPTQSRRNRKVAVIGSGPAGLTAAYDLAGKGYRVEMFESYKAPGGMLAWAIPEFRLPRHALARDIAYIESMGVRIATGASFGRDMRIQDLRDIGAHAVIIAAGTRKSLKMNLPYEADLEGYLDCLTFLRRYNEHDLPPIGNRILVVGGGNAAIDTARSALRQGGKVTLIYRRSREEMPAERDEVNEALGEGVEFMFRTAPFDILVEGGRFKGLECVNTEPAEPDGSGRRRPVVVQGSQFRILADTLISAVGQEPERDLICEGMCLEDRNLEIDSGTMRTCEDDVFVAGDFLNGPTTVVEAMASGRKAARAVDAYLSESCR